MHIIALYLRPHKGLPFDSTDQTNAVSLSGALLSSSVSEDALYSETCVQVPSVGKKRALMVCQGSAPLCSVLPSSSARSDHTQHKAIL